MNAFIRKELGEELINLDRLIDYLDKKVFEAAHIPACDKGLDAQLGRALDPSFMPPIKIARDQILMGRNTLAQLLGFGSRVAHSWNSRDYKVSTDGLVAA